MRRLSSLIVLAVTALLLVPTTPASAAGCTLPFGTTIGAIDVPVPGTTGFNLLKAAPRGAKLPNQVYLRDTHATFNRLWSFALDGGNVYAKPRTQSAGWRAVRMPACLAGQVAGIAADDQELLAIGRDGRFYTMAQALNAPILWNWTSRWGTPIWLSPDGFHLPPNTRAWTWSVLSANEDKTWTDPAGNNQLVYGKVSHVYALTGDGSHIAMIDPWFAHDFSYAVPGPVGGRFRSTAISASGSHVFVMNQYGDMYTRLFDFDTSGSNTAVMRYSYDDQSKLSAAPFFGLHLLPTYAAIQLPAEPWRHQPKVPGPITSRISIHKTGAGSASRELRVEGTQAGRTGYWHKMVAAKAWSFTATGQPLSASLIDNPAYDRSSQTLAPASGYTYTAKNPTYQVTVSGFRADSEQTPMQVSFPDGSRLDLTLHSVDGLRQWVRGDGLDSNARAYEGALEIPAKVLANLSGQSPAVQRFVRSVFGTKPFRHTVLYVTTDALTITALLTTLRG